MLATPTRRRGPGAEIPDRPTEPIDPTAAYTYEQAGGHLQMSARAVSKLVHSGRLGCSEFTGKTWRILGRQLLDFMDRNVKAPIR